MRVAYASLPASIAPVRVRSHNGGESPTTRSGLCRAFGSSLRNDLRHTRMASWTPCPASLPSLTCQGVAIRLFNHVGPKSASSSDLGRMTTSGST